jgi:hypothetical protein
VVMGLDKMRTGDILVSCSERWCWVTADEAIFVLLDGIIILNLGLPLMSWCLDFLNLSVTILMPIRYQVTHF